MVTKRNQRIGELFLTAAGLKDGPSLVHREVGLNTRLAACEVLVKLRGGLGRHSRDRLKRVLAELTATAKVKLGAEEFQKALDRIEAIQLRLENMADNRTEHQKLTAEQEQKLRETSKPPFEVTASTDVFWERDIRNGRVHWFLSIPAHVSFHITRRKANAERTISVDPRTVSSTRSS